MMLSHNSVSTSTDTNRHASFLYCLTEIIWLVQTKHTSSKRNVGEESLREKNKDETAQRIYPKMRMLIRTNREQTSETALNTVRTTSNPISASSIVVSCLQRHTPLSPPSWPSFSRLIRLRHQMFVLGRNEIYFPVFVANLFSWVRCCLASNEKRVQTSKV